MTMAAKKGMVLSSVATHSLCKYIFKNCENVTCASNLSHLEMRYERGQTVRLHARSAHGGR